METTVDAFDAQENDRLPNDKLLRKILLLALPSWPTWTRRTAESYREAATFLERMRFVCKRWDRVATAMPELWTTVAWDWWHFHTDPSAYGFDFSDMLSGFRRDLNRSGILPLNLELYNRHIRRPPFSRLPGHTFYTLDAEAHLLKLMDEIMFCAARVRSLRLVSFNEFVWPLEANWASLTSLTLYLRWEDYSANSLWFGHTAPLPPNSIPSLKYLRIHNDETSFGEVSKKENVEYRVLSGIRPSSLKSIHLLYCHYPDYDKFLRKCTLDNLTLEHCVEYVAGLEALPTRQVTFHSHIINLIDASDLFEQTVTHAHLDWRTIHHVEDLLLALPTFPALIVVQINPSFGLEIYAIETVLCMAPTLRALRLGKWLDMVDLENVLRMFLPDHYSSTGGMHQVAQDSNGFAPRLEYLELLFHPRLDIRREGDPLNDGYMGPGFLLSLLARRPGLKVIIGIATHNGRFVENPIVTRYTRLCRSFPHRLAFTYITEQSQPFSDDFSYARKTLNGTHSSFDALQSLMVSHRCCCPVDCASRHGMVTTSDRCRCLNVIVQNTAPLPRLRTRTIYRIDSSKYLDRCR